MSTPSFRPITKSDIPKLVEIEKLSGGVWTALQFEKELETKQSVNLCAVLDQTPVGFCAGWIVENVFQILEIAVHPQYRRQGLGRNMMLNILTQAQKQGCNRAELEVRDDNRQAQQFYLELGFIINGKRKNFYQTCDAILMEKSL